VTPRLSEGSQGADSSNARRALDGSRRDLLLSSFHVATDRITTRCSGINATVAASRRLLGGSWSHRQPGGLPVSAPRWLPVSLGAAPATDRAPRGAVSGGSGSRRCLASPTRTGGSRSRREVDPSQAAAKGVPRRAARGNGPPWPRLTRPPFAKLGTRQLAARSTRSMASQPYLPSCATTRRRARTISSAISQAASGISSALISGGKPPRSLWRSMTVATNPRTTNAPSCMAVADLISSPWVTVLGAAGAEEARRFAGAWDRAARGNGPWPRVTRPPFAS
jgi:hypothetical protein